MTTTDEALQRFAIEYQRYHSISPVRARQQLALLHEFAATLDGRALTEATASDLQSFAGMLVGSGVYHVNTVRKKLNMIRPFFSWAFAVHLVDADVYLRMKGVRNPRGSTGNSTPRPYTRTEMIEFWRTLNDRLPLLPIRGHRSQALTRWRNGTGTWRALKRHAMRLQIDAMVRCALDLGMRRSEIFGLHLDNLHYDNEYIVVHGKADPHTGQPKVRQVPITEHAREAIKAWVEFRALIDPPHFSPWLSLFYPDSYMNAMSDARFDNLLKAQIGPNWQWHRFRHTCATVWLRSGVELGDVSKLLGHASLQQTLAYAEILSTDIGRSMERHQEAFMEETGRAA